MNHIAVFMRAFDIELLDYPWQAAVQNAAEFAEEIIIVTGDEDSHQRLVEYTRTLGARFVIARGKFDLSDSRWQQAWWEYCRIWVNKLIPYHAWQDLDEIFPSHEIAHWQHQTHLQKDLIRFPFTHLYGTAYRQDTAFSLTHNTRMGYKDWYRMEDWSKKIAGAAACQAVYRGTKDAHRVTGNEYIFNLEQPILHYGWCRDIRSLAVSQNRHHAWYGHKNVPIHDEQTGYVFTDIAERTITFTGRHPACMADWISRHEEEWKKLWLK